MKPLPRDHQARGIVIGMKTQMLCLFEYFIKEYVNMVGFIVNQAEEGN